MAGQRVGVADMAGFEVAGAELCPVASIGHHRYNPLFAVDALDGSAGAVLDSDALAVAEADDPVAGCELAAADLEPVTAEAPVAVHEAARERVELGDVAAA